MSPRTPIWGARLDELQRRDFTREQARHVLDLLDELHAFHSASLARKVYAQLDERLWESCRADGWCTGLEHRTSQCPEDCEWYEADHGECDHRRDD